MNKDTDTYLLTFESSTLEEIKEYAESKHISITETIEKLVILGLVLEAKDPIED